MSTAGREIVINLHTSLGVRMPTLHTVQHMASGLDGGSLTPADLRASIVRSDAYRLSVRTRFRDACYALLGQDDEAAFRVFDAGGGGEPVEVTDLEINTSVRQSVRFEERYIDLIQRSFATLMSGETVPQAFLDAMLRRFRDDPTFLLEDLHRLIRSAGADPVSILDDFDDEESETSSLTGSQPLPVPLPVPNSVPVPLRQETLERILTEGDEVFGRPWYAQEYIAYHSECAVSPDLGRLLASLLWEHTAAWERARGAHARLLGEVLDEVDFVRKYVGRHRGSHFAEMLSTDILASPLYQQKIRGRLSHVQMRLYDLALTDEELGRLSIQAQIAGIGVGDDEVSVLLHAHRRECDALVSEVVGVYVDVLSREPDHRELLDEMEAFRGSVPPTARVELAVRLSKGYEFHDVVKTRLRSAYHSAAGGVHIPIQVMYTMLERVLEWSETSLRARGGATDGLTALVDDEIRRATA